MSTTKTADVPKQKDVSNYKTAAGAAKATANALREWAEFYGYDPDAINVYNPDETQRKRDMHGDVDCWTVSWEGGPYEWAVALTGGEWIGWNDVPGHGGDPEVTGLLESSEFGVECYYSFDIQFYNK